MNVTLFQPPYPSAGTVSAAEQCLSWMQTELDKLVPGDHDLVLLPEYANTPGIEDRHAVQEFAVNQGTRFLEAIPDFAKRLRCPIALAAMVRSGARWHNRSLLFDAAGHVAASYDKLHITDVERDELGLTPGSELRVFELGGLRVGFATCFDLYFPEHFEALAAQKMDIALCPSYQRSESDERIRLLARARAFDSGSYLLRSSYAMRDTLRGGHSLVATPTGDLLIDAESTACVVTAELNPKTKFEKPASHGQPTVEHRALIDSHRRPGTYRPHPARTRRIIDSAFPRLCAHRGLSKACPENTTPAFAAAISAGAHELEFDVRISCDNVLVICHDDTVDRTTDGRGKVAELSWAQISDLDAGIRCAESWVRTRIPRLKEVLEMADGRIGLNIHIKDTGPGDSTIRRVCDLVTERALVNIAYLALDTEAALSAARSYAPEIPRACLACQHDPSELLELAEQYECQRVQFGRNVKREHVRRAHELGMLCNLFWSDNPEEAGTYVNKGIDVILTNCAHSLVGDVFHALGGETYAQT
jgi:glycerophosphoryl diester phosphodiesterase